jgi:hypothetical protein
LVTVGVDRSAKKKKKSRHFGLLHGPEPGTAWGRSGAGGFIPMLLAQAVLINEMNRQSLYFSNDGKPFLLATRTGTYLLSGAGKPLDAEPGLCYIFERVARETAHM